MHSSAASTEVVVARFSEDLSWSDKLSVPVTIYDKSKDRPNVGREAETFAYHVIMRYDSLANTTVFLQGNPTDHIEMPLEDAIKRINAGAIGEGGLGKRLVADDHGNPHHHGLPVGQTFAELFADEAKPNGFAFYAGAQYIVSASSIKKRTHAWWKRLHRVLETEEVCPWTMERLWMYAFSIDAKKLNI
jgi:hypothetical protein